MIVRRDPWLLVKDCWAETDGELVLVRSELGNEGTGEGRLPGSISILAAVCPAAIAAASVHFWIFSGDEITVRSVFLCIVEEALPWVSQTG